jgi:RimJ/RimL family protein N-acetyltransferase
MFEGESALVSGSFAIETSRLRLRPFRETDLDDLARLNADPAVVRYLGSGKPLSRDETWRQIAAVVGHRELRGYTALAIEDRASGAFLGRSGPWFPEGWPMLEVGWVIDPRKQGEGIATEAGRASLDWCFANLEVDEVCSVIHPENAASARVAAKLGGRLDRRIEDGVFAVPVDVWIHCRGGQTRDQTTVQSPAMIDHASGPAMKDGLIETKRLRLRSFRGSDLDDLARLYADPEVMLYLGAGKTMSRAETWRQIAVILGHQQIRGYSTLAIEDRSTGAFIGESGPWFPEGWPMLEVGWVVDPRRQGEGIATEAGRASLDWCFANLGAREICSIIRAENRPSARVAAKLGARIEGRLDDFFDAPADLWIHRQS